MNLLRVFLRSSLLGGIFLGQIMGWAAWAQVRPRVVEAVDDARRVTLTGNVHPLAQAAFDRGAVADAQPITRMLLLLKRGEEQENALTAFLEQQQEKGSVSYHAWLTPEEFGAQFGPADADVQKVTDWLTQQGFAVGKVYSGKTVIEFSGTAGQVQRAFRSSLRNYAVGEKIYTANANDPQIPAALAPVVTGIVSLNNFPRKSYARRVGSVRRELGKAGLKPLYTFPSPFYSGTFFGVGPADFATIYNSAGLIQGGNNGTGQTIAIVGETNINVQDVKDFRKMFGLPATFDASNVILNGEDPGLTSIDEEGEADLDVEWSGAVAPGATVKFVVSASTPASAGVDLSALYIIEHNLAGVISESYGDCEQNLGAAGNAFYNQLWEQAAAQGITVMLSSGDGGSAGCDDFNSGKAAHLGLAVSGFASTPYNVSVGGTDFDQIHDSNLYWNSTNDPVTGESAKGYIPEIPWNENCSQLGLTKCGTGAPQGSQNSVAGSGGPSTIYAKPKWQMGVTGMPNDNHRDQPDISLFASPIFDGSGYLYCQSDSTISGARSCDLTAGFTDFGVIGGTSASSPAFAGVMALVNQYQAAHGGTARQGNANVVLYALSKQTGASCASSATEASTCIFNDITHGNRGITGGLGVNSVACVGGTPNCSVTVGTGTGVLVDPAHTTTEAWTVGTGYDMVNGLGSVNINNLVKAWGTASTVGTTATLSLSPTSGITHGTKENVGVTIHVSATGGGVPTGDVALVANLPDGQHGMGEFTLVNGAVTGVSTQSLPGGSYTVYAHYTGDGTNAPSDSSGVAVTVGKETSQTFLVVPTFDANGQPLSANATTFPYGTSFIVRAYVTDKNGVGNAGGPPSPDCVAENQLACPTGTVSLTDNASALGQGGFHLNNAGYTRDLSETAATFLGGTHAVVATYGGDSSYSGSTGSTSITVTPAPSTTANAGTPLLVMVGQPLQVVFNMTANVPGGVPPTGTFSYFDNGSPLSGQASTVPNTFGQQLIGNLATTLTTVGPHTISARYSGDGNYAASTSSNDLVVNAQYGETLTLKSGADSYIYGNPVTLTAKLTTPHLTPVLTGHFVFQGVGSGLESINLTTDGSGNQILSATLTYTPTQGNYAQVNYVSDPNYADNSTFLFLNIITPDFALGPSDGVAVTAPAGQGASGQLTITPTSQNASTVMLALQTNTQISGYTLGINPAQVNLNGSAATAMITLTPNVAVPANAIHAQARKAGFFDLGAGGWRLRGLGGLASLLFLLGIPGRRKRVRSALGMAGVCAMCFVLGCGGGGGSSGGGGGGGGVTGPQPTSISLASSSSKAPSGGVVTITATVHGTGAITGGVTFYDFGNAITPPLPLTNGQVQIGANYFPVVGIHQLSASYNGDAKNLQSTSPAITQLITGQVTETVQGITGGNIHYVPVVVTLQ